MQSVGRVKTRAAVAAFFICRDTIAAGRVLRPILERYGRFNYVNG